MRPPKRFLALAGILVATVALVTSVTVAVTAGAGNASVTYYGCLAAGKLTQVGTTPPTCTGAATQISWNSVGPQGVQGVQGVQGAPGPAGPQGPAGPGALYIADNSNGTGLTPQTLKSNVNGFTTALTCDTSASGLVFQVDASWTGTNPNVGLVSQYGLNNGVPAFTASRSGATLRNPLFLSQLGLDVDNSSGTDYAQGFVVANSGGIASQPESGFWYSLYFSATIGAPGGGGNCTVTGVLVPVKGSRLVPLPIHVP